MPATNGAIDPGKHASHGAPTNEDIDPEDVEFDPMDIDGCCPDWLDDEDEEDEGEPTTHRQAIAQWGDQRGRVDVELAPLITEMWRAGLETISSCQDVGESLVDLGRRHPHMASYVAAKHGRSLIDLSPPDAQPFLDMVTAVDPSSGLYDRMTRWTAEGAWQYGLVMLDLPDDEGRYSFRILAIQVGFPRSDIEEVTRCLHDQNELLESARRLAIAGARRAGAKRR